MVSLQLKLWFVYYIICSNTHQHKAFIYEKMGEGFYVVVLLRVNM